MVKDACAGCVCVIIDYGILKEDSTKSRFANLCIFLSVCSYARICVCLGECVSLPHTFVLFVSLQVAL